MQKGNKNRWILIFKKGKNYRRNKFKWFNNNNNDGDTKFVRGNNRKFKQRFKSNRPMINILLEEEEDFKDLNLIFELFFILGIVLNNLINKYLYIKL